MWSTSTNQKEDLSNKILEIANIEDSNLRMRKALNLIILCTISSVDVKRQRDYICIVAQAALYPEDYKEVDCNELN
jgi:hypothetical protein